MALHVVHKTIPVSIKYKCLPMVTVLSSVQSTALDDGDVKLRSRDNAWQPWATEGKSTAREKHTLEAVRGKTHPPGEKGIKLISRYVELQVSFFPLPFYDEDFLFEMVDPVLRYVVWR